MYQKVCDRCGEKMPVSLTSIMHQRMYGYVLTKGNGADRKEIHLCDECQRKLTKWLNTGADGSTTGGGIWNNES